MADPPTLEELKQRIQELEQAESKLKPLEEALRESEKRSHSLLQNIQAAVVVHGPDTAIIECNKTAQELLGLTKDQVLGKKAIDPFWRFFDETGNDIPLARYPVNWVIANRNVLKNAIAGIYRPNQDDIVKIIVTAVPEFDSDGNISQVIVTFMDITELKRAEEALRESEERYRSLFENTGTATFVIEEDMTVSQVNTKCEELTGYSKGEIEGKMKTTDFLPVEELERIKKYHFSRRKEDDKPPPEYEFNLLDKHGNKKNVYTQVGIIPKTMQSIASIIDITPLRQAEKALRESEIKFRTLADFSPTAISIIRGERYLYVNSAWETLTGYTKDEARSLNPLLVVHPDMRELVKNYSINRMKGEQTPTRYEMKGITKIGGVKWFDFSATLIEYDGEQATLTVVNDITDKKQSDKEREQLIIELREAINEIKTLRGILPICSSCKKIRDDKGYWNQIELYIRNHSNAQFSHGICPECAKKLYPYLDIHKKR